MANENILVLFRHTPFATYLGKLFFFEPGDIIDSPNVYARYSLKMQYIFLCFAQNFPFSSI